MVMKNGMRIFLVLILLGGLFLGCSGPRKAMGERKIQCAKCSLALASQEDVDKIVMNEILERIRDQK
jgi:hypothetical protein